MMPGLRAQNLFFSTARVCDVPLPPLPDLKSSRFQPLFKFLHSRHLERLTVDETVQINSSKVFRDQYFRMEVKNHRINDPEEGRRMYHQAEFDAGDELQSHNSLGAILEPFHMLCLTLGTFEEGCQTFCLPDEGLDKPYDACVEITDTPGFAALFQPEALIKNPETGVFDLPLRAAFENVHFGEVAYTRIHEPLAEDVRTFRLPPLSPYLKDASLSAQREFRIVFIPNQFELKPQPFVVKLPGLAKLIRVRGTDAVKRAVGKPN